MRAEEDWSQWLERMDELRYEDAELVLEKLRERIEEVPWWLVPRFLGVCGSAYRTSGARLKQADRCIAMGLWFAARNGDRSAYADLIQRRAYVVADRGDFTRSLDLAAHAGAIHLRIGDLGAVGKTLVDQGVFLCYLGRYRAAIGLSELALNLLPEDADRNRFSAFHSLGRLHWLLREDSEALSYLEKALSLADRVGPWLVAKVHWLKAEILEDLGRYDKAEIELREVVETYKQRSPLATALATVDRARVQLRQGHAERARESIRSAVPLVNDLNRNRLASAALVDLLRSDAAGLTIQRLNRARRQLEEARERERSRVKRRRRPQLS